LPQDNKYHFSVSLIDDRSRFGVKLEPVEISEVTENHEVFRDPPWMLLTRDIPDRKKDYESE